MGPKETKQFWGNKSFFFLSVLLALICFTVYFNSLSNDFVWDDRAIILNDKTIKDLRNIPQAFTRDFFDFSDDEEIKYGYFRPLITISYAIDYALWKKNAFGFHLTNLLIHIACSIFVFCLFVLLGQSRYLAFLGSVLFAVHPIHTETVSWIAGRTDLFCCLFFLPALGAYIIYRQDHRFKFPCISTNIFYVLSLLFYSLSLLSKEMGLVLIFIIPFMEWQYFSKDDKGGDWTNFITRISPYIALTIGFLFWHSKVVSRLSFNRINGNLIATIASFFKGFWIYIYKLLLPIHLSAYLKVKMFTGFSQPISWLYCLMFVVFVFVFLFGSKYKPLLRLGGGFFLMSMAPIINIIRISSPIDMGFTIAERFMYIPSIGFILFLVETLNWGIETVLKKYPSIKQISTIAVVFVIGTLGYRTILRNRDWRDDGTLFNAELAANNESVLIHSNLGRFYARKSEYDKAIYHMKRSVYLAPDSPELMNNLGKILVDMGKFKEAVFYLEKSIVLAPSIFKFYNNLGLAEAGLGNYQDAIEAYKKALKCYPSSAQVYNNMGVALRELGDFQKAHDSYLKAVDYNPDYAAPYKNLGIIYWENLAKPAQAIEALRKSLQIDPDQVDAPLMRKHIKSFPEMKFQGG